MNDKSTQVRMTIGTILTSCGIIGFGYFLIYFLNPAFQFEFGGCGHRLCMYQCEILTYVLVGSFFVLFAGISLLRSSFATTNYDTTKKNERTPMEARPVIVQALVQPREGGNIKTNSTNYKLDENGKMTLSVKSTDAITLHAIPSIGWEFIGWYEVDEIKSQSNLLNSALLNSSPTLSFKANKNCEVVAKFEQLI